MVENISSLQKNETQKLIDLLKNKKKPHNNGQVYWTKHKVSKEIDSLKTRLIKSYVQMFGIDFQKKHSPVANIIIFG